MKKVLIIILGLILFLGVFLFSLAYLNYKKTIESVFESEEFKTWQQYKAISEKASLASGADSLEQPSFVSIANVDELRKENSFFEVAQNGDMLLIYNISGKAVLYRPQTDEIISIINISTFDEEVVDDSNKAL